MRPKAQGMIGIWEWYVNPERPEIAEITGLALVQKGRNGEQVLPLLNQSAATIYQ